MAEEANPISPKQVRASPPSHPDEFRGPRKREQKRAIAVDVNRPSGTETQLNPAAGEAYRFSIEGQQPPGDFRLEHDL